MNNLSSNRIPILTIGGFLGSGKTTLVNNILQNSGGRRIVVFVNDFGAINIDYDLVDTIEEDRVSLKNGCVCCSLNDDLIKQVSEFTKQVDPPDAIIIEASGIADPRALDSSLNILEESGLIRLDNKLYVIDSINYGSLEYDDAELIIDHAAASDMIFLNKIDLISDEKMSNLQNIVIQAAPYTTIINTEYCHFDIDIIFDLSAPLEKKLPRNQKTSKSIDHSDRYSSYTYETKQLIDREKFTVFMKMLPKSCLRAKGILKYSDRPDKHQVFNLVGFRATLETKLELDDSASSQFVAIGLIEKMNIPEINQAFLETLLPLN